ncbi:16S rRNA (cytosine(1402)-N(4))-methyltransferase RsmH [Alkalibaculum sp. M08DMB]|uniref:Ribosomal RNA small subunit methyltransferase H n=1 Tax=Alkalibaculum sporogenes TaxID=2655001 RepID=A0A6A7K7T4_9FIRM|nr:16S rRNA (cytosine(1402)-N(4))-methyltransferase RsmH [Alkalibaculum sporogenes]MPW25173.1 16S rRNA (cytosine(1402)-N(4))-methyltransferase RsmH [Alkalibaculum sporogenes]
MELMHTSVLLDECLSGLNIKENGIYVDATLGGAGHSREICKLLSKNGTLIGIDQDDYALERATKNLDVFECKKILVRDNFRNIKDIISNLDINEVDGILMDLGVSSFQLDDADRGFSYNNQAKLDMRMDKRSEFSAYNLVNEYSEREIFRVIRQYGEEKFASRIAKTIVKARVDNPIETTEDLVEIIKRSIPAKFRREGPHPAKRTFQAIRIEVNSELSILEDAIKDSIFRLAIGGRICMISFHSLEDRIIKQTYKALANPCKCPPDFPECACGKVPSIEVVTRKPIYPSQVELDNNPRSRSAKLRVAQKI